MARITLAATALMACLLLSGCSNNYAANIERVLKQDQGTTQKATSVATVVARKRAINLDGCPQDFTLAYIAHINAWESLLAVEEEAKAFDANFNSGEAMIEAFLRGMVFDFGILSEARAAQDRLRANYQKALAEIRQTFHRVEEIAVKHGAKLPKKQ
jgi:outer membrane murein-binding lipoprotein Lpp